MAFKGLFQPELFYDSLSLIVEMTESGMTEVRNMKMGHRPVKMMAIVSFLAFIAELFFRNPVLTNQTRKHLHSPIASWSGSQSTPIELC